MIQVTYTSIASDGFAPADLFAIIETAAKNNAKIDLTGFLMFCEGRFFQVIEGPEASIDALLAKLNRDPRHHSLEILDRSEVERRTFPKWRMRRFSTGLGAQSFADVEAELEGASPRLKETARDFLEARYEKSA